MKVETPPERFFSVRTAVGWLLGTAVWLVYALVFNRPSQFSPYISLILAGWISNLRGPKHLAALGALLGAAAGLLPGIQFVLQNPFQLGDIISWIAAYFTVSFVMIAVTAYYALIGFVFAQLARLYSKGAIF